MNKKELIRTISQEIGYKVPQEKIALILAKVVERGNVRSIPGNL